MGFLSKKCVQGALTVACLIFQFTANAADDTNQGTDTPEEIEKLFDIWKTEGLRSQNVKAEDTQRPAIQVQIAATHEPNLYTSKSLSFPFAVGTLGTGTTNTVSVREIFDGIFRVCTQEKGKLEFKPTSVGISDPVIGSAVNDLHREKLSGTHKCISEGKIQFQVEIYPSPSGTQAFFKKKWNVYVHLVNRKQIALHERIYKERSAGAADFRQTLAPGMQVALWAADVPANLQPKFGEQADRLLGNKHMICGLVIEVRPALVQVQIEQGLLFVQTEKVFQFKKKINPRKEFTSDWSEWCAGT